MLRELALPQWIRFDSDFITLAHRHQEPPAFGSGGQPWTTWLMLGGRGAGKTRLARNGYGRRSTARAHTLINVA
jgi:phage terminase large subunit-like protein